MSFVVASSVELVSLQSQVVGELLLRPFGLRNIPEVEAGKEIDGISEELNLVFTLAEVGSEALENLDIVLTVFGPFMIPKEVFALVFKGLRRPIGVHVI